MTTLANAAKAGTQPATGRAGSGRLRAAVLAAFLEQVDTAVLPAYDAIRLLPGYRDLGEAAAMQVLRSVRWVVVTLTDCVSDDRPLTGREVARLHDIGVAGARWGIPFGAFQQAFSVGCVHAATRLREVARALGDDGRVTDTIMRDLMRPLADAASVREEGFAGISGDPVSHEAVQRAALLGSVLRGAAQA